MTYMSNSGQVIPQSQPTNSNAKRPKKETKAKSKKSKNGNSNSEQMNKNNSSNQILTPGQNFVEGFSNGQVQQQQQQQQQILGHMNGNPNNNFVPNGQQQQQQQHQQMASIPTNMMQPQHSHPQIHQQNSVQNGFSTNGPMKTNPQQYFQQGLKLENHHQNNNNNQIHQNIQMNIQNGHAGVGQPRLNSGQITLNDIHNNLQQSNQSVSGGQTQNQNYQSTNQHQHQNPLIQRSNSHNQNAANSSSNPTQGSPIDAASISAQNANNNSPTTSAMDSAIDNTSPYSLQNNNGSGQNMQMQQSLQQQNGFQIKGGHDNFQVNCIRQPNLLTKSNHPQPNQTLHPNQIPLQPSHNNQIQTNINGNLPNGHPNNPGQNHQNYNPNHQNNQNSQNQNQNQNPGPNNSNSNLNNNNGNNSNNLNNLQLATDNLDHKQLEELCEDTIINNDALDDLDDFEGLDFPNDLTMEDFEAMT